MSFKTFGYLKDIGLTILSALLLVLSFPRFDLGFLAWVSLVPLFLAISGKSLRYGFILSTVCGIFFITGMFDWILEVPDYLLVHHAMLALYLGCYFGIFGLTFNFFGRYCGVSTALFAAPFVWVLLEYVRSNLSFLALPWGLLGHSQYQQPSVIQIASLAGTYSISFLIVIVNSALTSLVSPLITKAGRLIPPSIEFPTVKAKWFLVCVAATCTTFSLLYGHLIISQPLKGKKISVALIQGNIEQDKKWDRKYAREIMQIYSDLTLGDTKGQPDLIIWPETATPGSMGLNPGLADELGTIAKKVSSYLLLGSAEHQKFHKSGDTDHTYFNSAFLVSPQAGIVKTQRYDKIRLFPFGEYLPFEEIIPWTFISVTDSSHYTPGEDYTVFKLPGFRFGVTICWENLFPDMVRQFVRQGAQFIINITNEARFGKTAAPYQLVALNVFRSVENRIFVIRCANTGISCIIDPYGRIANRLQGPSGEDIFVKGVLHGSVIPLAPMTIYTQYGELAVWASILGIFPFFLIAFRRLKKPDVQQIPSPKMEEIG